MHYEKTGGLYRAPLRASVILSPGQSTCAAARGDSTAPAQASPRRAALTGAIIPCDFYATPSSHFCAGVRRLAVSGVSQRC